MPSLTTVAFHAQAAFDFQPYRRSGRSRQVCREPEMIVARAYICFACRAMADASYPDIAKALGLRCHSSVVYSVQAAQEIDPLELARFCVRIQEQIGGESRVASWHDPFHRAASAPLPAPQRKGALVGQDEGRQEVPGRRGDHCEPVRVWESPAQRKAATPLPPANRKRARR